MNSLLILTDKVIFYCVFQYVNANDSISGPSTSSYKSRSKPLKFIISHKGHIVTVSLHENQNVVDLKQQIQKSTNVPLCRQYLVGWKKYPKSDNCKLSSLNLASETKLTLNTLDADQDGQMDINE